LDRSGALPDEARHRAAGGADLFFASLCVAFEQQKNKSNKK
jgi:hypothetical protein